MFLKFTKNEVLIIFGLCLLKFGVGFISSMVIPVFPSLLRIHFNNSFQNSSINFLLENKTNYNYYQLSILFATRNICQIFFSPIVGILADLFGYLILLLSGTIFHVLTMFVYGLGNLYYLLILGRVFEAISASIINCAAAAYVPFRFKNHKQRGFLYGVEALSTCIGNSIGPGYAGIIYEYYGKMFLFLSFLGVVFLEIILVLLIIFTENLLAKSRTRNCILDVEIPVMKNDIVDIENENTHCLSEEKFGNEEKFSLNKISDEILKEKITNIDNENTLCPSEENMVNEENVSSNKVSDNHFEEKIKKKENKKENIFIKNLLFFKDPYFLISIGTFPIIFITTYLLFSTLPRHMLLKYNSTESQQGAVWLLTLLGYGLGFVIGNVINTRFSINRHIIIMSYTFLHALVIVCISFMPTWWSVTIPLCIIVHIHLVAEVVISPILANIVELRHDSRFGVMTGIIMTAMSITGSLGSFLGPILLSSIGFMYTNIGVCILNILYAPFYLFLKRFCQ